MDEQSSNEKIYKQITKRVEKRFEERAEFFSHLAVFVVAMVLIYWLRLDGTMATISSICTGLWAMGLIIHGIQFVFGELRERALQRELERAGLIAPHLTHDKRKRRERLVQLSDDGELVDMDDVDYHDAGREARSRHK